VKNHPLFQNVPGYTEAEQQKVNETDLGTLHLARFVGGKLQGIPKSWDSEELQSVEDIYEALEKIRKGGGSGTFELTARNRDKKWFQAKTRITIEGLSDDSDEPEEKPAPPPQAPPSIPQMGPPATPSMTGTGLQIPVGTDPQTAMLFMFSNMQLEQQRQAREDSRQNQLVMQQMFIAFSKNQADLVVGLVNGRQAPPSESSADLLVKGVEMGVELMKGAAEAKQESDNDKPLDMNSIASNIAQSIAGIRDIAVATGNRGPVIPPQGTP
jgi:ATP-dependent exoDNAse (exonuclease V) beta subunit